MKKMDEVLAISKLCDHIRETAFALHTNFRDGYREKVYENGLAHRLRKAGIKVVQQMPLRVSEEEGPFLENSSPIFSRKTVGSLN